MPLQVEARSLRARRDRVRWALQLYVHAYSVAERQGQCLAIRHVTEMAPVTVLCPLRAAEHAELSVGLLLSSQKTQVTAQQAPGSALPHASRRLHAVRLCPSPW